MAVIRVADAEVELLPELTQLLPTPPLLLPLFLRQLLNRVKKLPHVRNLNANLNLNLPLHQTILNPWRPKQPNCRLNWKKRTAERLKLKPLRIRNAETLKKRNKEKLKNNEPKRRLLQPPQRKRRIAELRPLLNNSNETMMKDAKLKKPLRNRRLNLKQKRPGWLLRSAPYRKKWQN
jgi:hypothetical protein